MEKAISYLKLINWWDLLFPIVILVVGVWLAKLAAAITEKSLNRPGFNRTLASFIKNIVYFGIIIFVVLGALERIGIKTTSFIALVGAAGLAIGLALQGSLSNFASGVMLIIFHPFVVGDKIEAAGVAGTVEEIQIFNTILKSADNKRKIVPNSKITADVISVDIK
jgi:small conductance mechanosensitive channel